MCLSETGDHLVFCCIGTRGGVGCNWPSGIEMDEKFKCAYEFLQGGKICVSDWVEDFITWLDQELSAVR